MKKQTFLFPPPPAPSLPVRGESRRFPVRRIFCVGRNYAAHAAEMGITVDKTRDQPFYFTKSPTALVESGATLAYPPRTANYHHEIELVVALGASAFQLSAADAAKVIFGYACGLDMTRRDLQLVYRERRHPWDLAKDVEQSAVVSEIVPAASATLSEKSGITLAVNGQTRQKADLSQMIWSVPELLADLSTYYHLEPGDLLFTGTPEGVGRVVAGDRVSGSIAGVGTIELTIDD